MNISVWSVLIASIVTYCQYSCQRFLYSHIAILCDFYIVAKGFYILYSHQITIVAHHPPVFGICTAGPSKRWCCVLSNVAWFTSLQGKNRSNSKKYFKHDEAGLYTCIYNYIYIYICCQMFADHFMHVHTCHLWSFRHVYVSHCSSSGGFEISRENSCFEPNRVAPPLPRLGAVSIWSWNLVCPRES